jgi:hypothetical protein
VANARPSMNFFACYLYGVTEFQKSARHHTDSERRADAQLTLSRIRRGEKSLKIYIDEEGALRPGGGCGHVASIRCDRSVSETVIQAGFRPRGFDNG